MFYIIFVYSFFNLYLIRFFFTLPGFSFLFDIKQFLLKLKNPAVYLNLVFTNLKKYFLFLMNEKFFNSSKLTIAFVSTLISKFLFWRPLFKRFSYFGNFKLTNSKFNKN